MPLSFVIAHAYGFQVYQFRPDHPCCQARFDFTAKVPKGTTKEQFWRMLQDLLVERSSSHSTMSKRKWRFIS